MASRSAFKGQYCNTINHSSTSSSSSCATEQSENDDDRPYRLTSRAKRRGPHPTTRTTVTASDTTSTVSSSTPSRKGLSKSLKTQLAIDIQTRGKPNSKHRQQVQNQVTPWKKEAHDDFNSFASLTRPPTLKYQVKQ